jgi:hypothetical protein
MLLTGSGCTMAEDSKPSATPTVNQPLLQPVNLTQFFLRPDRNETLTWRFAGEAAGAPCEVRNYRGQLLFSRPVPVENGEAKLSLQLPAGFYELAFQSTGQRFGVVAIDPHRGGVDKFFALDAALSWLETRPEVRNDLVALLKRSGIGLVRERLSWGAVNPQPDQWDWETNRQFDTLRREYARQDIQVLELFHAAPAWTKVNAANPYPQRLPEVQRSWQTIAKRWQANWAGLEVWNEPDIESGGELPADQYLPVVKTINYAFQENRVRSGVGGGVFGYFNPAYIGSAVKNGLLDQVDFVSFHTYAKAPALEQIIQDYRNALAVKGQAPVPLWLTESGQPWKSGPERPSTEEDAASALDIAMKAVEARACGIARYFGFVYPYYIEGPRNFGMMGREVTPLRSMSAYVQATAALSGTHYAGDLDLPSVQRARVFARGDSAVVVLYAEKAAPGATIAWSAPVQRLEGIDGRVLNRLADGSIPLPDGLTYVYVPLKALAGSLRRQTRAAQLAATAKSARAVRPAASAVVLQPLMPVTIQPTKRGYKFATAQGTAFPFRVRVNNLSNLPRRVALRCTATGGAVLPEQTVELTARSTSEVQWDIDIARMLEHSGAEAVTLDVTGKDGTVPVSPLAVEVLGERDLPTYLRFYPASTKLDITALARWQPKVSATGQMQMRLTDGRNWQLETTFKAGDRWAYPEFPLPENPTLKSSAGLILRARSSAAGVARLMLKERSGAIYFTPFSIVPPDNEWHSALVRWEDLAALPSAPPDANGQLDLDQVVAIAIGLNPKADANTLEVSDLYVARKGS